MTVLDAISAMGPELIDWRHSLHSHPETAFEEHRTAAFIARELRAMGLEVHEGIAGTGVVGVLRNGTGWSVGLRADIDALDVTEATGLPYASQVPGKMHACGHDGHTTMLLGAARAMAANPPGPGTVVFIFQPAEENEGGARVMLEDGLLARFPVDQVYSMHNWPGLAAGHFAVHTGPVMAAFDTFELRVNGRGSHGAMPHEGIDAITLAAQIQLGWQTLVSRAVAPVDPAVISITQVFGGDTLNAIPARVTLRGTVRTFRPETRDFLETEMAFRAKGIAAACHAEAELDYTRRYPATVNAARPAVIARAAAETVAGAEFVATDLPPSMAAEDFAFLLAEVPGAYVWIGNGPVEGGRNLHSPHYQFNDDILPVGVHYLCEVAARALAQDNQRD
ncbi:M20 aminoacylase family protein [Antarcticimicrobium sediminis]|uniref:Amidohydrolase n=1 Tax=Antarcticimicrobium sediminis TaxID=2546227 RepID=A0A4R5EKC7_9RHOB|nr:M20 aminoacylase family protein [Antarcticimicrobium sediminis]TDE34948.1 amidohydrolase [Antarcticimicrobium sediminis]